jgi:hypothetical protein
MGLINLSAEFRRRIDGASGHSNTIPELCAPHTNPAIDQIPDFIVSMKHDALRRQLGVFSLGVFATWRLPAFYKTSSITRQLFFTDFISYFVYSLLSSEKAQNLNKSTCQLFISQCLLRHNNLEHQQGCKEPRFI